MHRVFCFFFSVVRYKVMIPSAFNTELNKINSTSIGATYLINTIYSFLLLNFCVEDSTSSVGMEMADAVGRFPSDNCSRTGLVNAKHTAETTPNITPAQAAVAILVAICFLLGAGLTIFSLIKSRSFFFSGFFSGSCISDIHVLLTS